MNTAPATITTVRKIVEEKMAVRVRWPNETGRGVLVDLFTAGRIVAVHNAVNDMNKAKIERMIAANSGQFLKIVDFCMKA